MSNPHQFHNPQAKLTRKTAQNAYQKKAQYQQLPPTRAYNRTTGDYYQHHNKPVTVYVKKTKEESPKEHKEYAPSNQKSYALPREVCFYFHLNEESFPIPSFQ